MIQKTQAGPEWLNESLDLNPFDMLLHYLTHTVHVPKTLAVLKHFCKEESAKNPQQCERRIAITITKI